MTQKSSRTQTKKTTPATGRTLETPRAVEPHAITAPLDDAADRLDEAIAVVGMFRERSRLIDDPAADRRVLNVIERLCGDANNRIAGARAIADRREGR